MNTSNSVPASQAGPEKGRVGWRQVLVPAAVILLFGAAPFLGAGTLAWPAGWLYVILIVAGSAVSRMVMARAHPELVAERARFVGNEGTKSFDKVLVPVIALGPTVIAFVAGLNYRFDWPPAIGLAVQAIGLLLVLAGMVLSSWAMVENRFFSSVVRIQTDRGQRVVDTGPYGVVRHPGYAGSLPAQFGMALLLGSAWALVPALLIVAVIVLRTSLEDRMLQAELPGYREYTAKVRYRLVPGIW